jgi:hypothetical protein
MNLAAALTVPGRALHRFEPPSAATRDTLPHSLRGTLRSFDDEAPASACMRRLIDAGLHDLPLPGSGRTLLRWQCLAEVAAFDLLPAPIRQCHDERDVMALGTAIAEQGLAVQPQLPWGDIHRKAASVSGSASGLTGESPWLL